ncbi:CU044_2847 family protein [Streptomyces cyaneofuscatus]|uniref:CU044_2847 family protein n=1 Tax=Streptomyces cyaneofuscatus TaxID=66883 RepID=UPI0033E03462
MCGPRAPGSATLIPLGGHCRQPLVRYCAQICLRHQAAEMGAVVCLRQWCRVGERTAMDNQHVVEARLPGGEVISIVATATSAGNPAQDIAARGIPSLDEVRSAITGMATLARDAVEAVRPDSASVEFGVDVKVESGALSGLIVSGSANATLKVTLTWDATPPPSA